MKKKLFLFILSGLFLLNVNLFAQTAQTINFTAIPNQTALATTVTITATAQSAYDVDFAVTVGNSIATAIAFDGNASGVCTATVTLSGSTGTVTIKATCPANGSFAVATPVSRTFNVIKAPNAVTFPVIANQTLAAGEALTFTPAVASATGGTITYSATGTALGSFNPTTREITTNQAGGTITVIATAAGGGYATASATRTFAVSKTANDIAFPIIANQTLLAGAALTFTPTAATSTGCTITYSATGTAFGSINAATGEVTTNKAGGTITVKATAAGTGYATASVSRTFSVSKTPNVVTFASIPNVTLTAGAAAESAALGASATSGGAITYTATGTALASIVALTGVITTNQLGGTITVKATPAAVAGYATATPVSRTFLVSKTANVVALPAIANQTLLAGAALAMPAFAVATNTGGVITYTASGTALGSFNPTTREITTNQAGGTITVIATASGAGYVTTSASRTFTVSKTANVISFPVIANQLMSDETFTQLATVTSGTIAHTSSNTAVATVISATGEITFVGGGTVTITASAIPTIGYAKPVSVSRTFAITKSNQTITWDAIDAPVLTTDGTVSVSALSSAGDNTDFPILYSVVSGPAIISDPTDGTVDLTGVAGTVVLKATQVGTATYNSAYKTTSFVVTAATSPLKISFYPNPATGSFKFTNLTEDAKVSIVDQKGNVKLVENLNSFELGNSIDISNLSKGIYYIVVETASGSTQQMLKKE